MSTMPWVSRWAGITGTPARSPFAPKSQQPLPSFSTGQGARDINVAAWISIIIVLILALNIFAVAIYGEAEFVFASIKIVTIVGLLLLALIIDCGGVPGQHRLGFQYWNNPGAMKPYIASGASGRFLGLWSTLVNAAFLLRRCRNGGRGCW